MWGSTAEGIFSEASLVLLIVRRRRLQIICSFPMVIFSGMYVECAPGVMLYISSVPLSLISKKMVGRTKETM